MSRVAFNKVSKRFDHDTIALCNFSLSVEDGELMVLVGPSGCGKSTALRLLAGLESVSDGEILIDGQVVNQTTPQQRNIAMVFQNYALYPHMSVRANLAFPLRMRHSSADEIDSKVSHIAGILDLTDLLERKPKQLSGGQRQRVAMGRALVRDPSVFLLDEPLSNLDAKLRAQIRADIAQLQKRLNKTTLYVTHDQVEAMTLGDRVAVMNAGELQQVGTPRALYETPQNIFVARFLGSPGMNIVSSRLLSESDAHLAVSLGNQTVELSSAKQQTCPGLLQYSDKSLFVGIRPEAFSASPVSNGVGIEVNVLSVEFLGHESLVYFQWSGTSKHNTDNVLIARIAGRYANADKTDARFYVVPDAFYLFNEEGWVIQ